MGIDHRNQTQSEYVTQFMHNTQVSVWLTKLEADIAKAVFNNPDKSGKLQLIEIFGPQSQESSSHGGHHRLARRRVKRRTTMKPKLKVKKIHSGAVHAIKANCVHKKNQKPSSAKSSSSKNKTTAKQCNSKSKTMSLRKLPPITKKSKSKSSNKVKSAKSSKTTSPTTSATLKHPKPAASNRQRQSVQAT